MTEIKLNKISIKNLDDAKKAISDIGCDPNSIEIMAPKMITRVIKLENIILQDAIIIKQDMLSIGGEVAVPRDTFELHQQTGDILIIGTIRQISELVKKLRRHYSRLKKIADEIEIFMKDSK